MFAAFPYRLFSSFLSPFVQRVPVMLKLMKTIEFNVWNQLDGWNCTSVYEGLAVCSARTHGIRGLGSEVVRRCEALAKEKGCGYTYLLATGNYSRRLFAGLGYAHLNTSPTQSSRTARGSSTSRTP